MPPRPENMRYWCHDCRQEIEAILVPDPLCPSCHGSFVEEITPEFESELEHVGRDDENDGNGTGQLVGAPAGAEGGPVLFEFAAPDGRRGVALRFSGAGMLPGQQGAVPNPPMNPFAAILSAFGVVPPVARAADARQTDAGHAPAGEHDRDGQVPIQNLASFLGEAFNPHPADHPNNNPFAEGGYEEPPEQPAHAAGQAPGNFLLSLLQSIGMDGAQVMLGAHGGGARNFGDFAWGEAGFQQILTDLMEQASGRAGPQPATDEIINELPHMKVTKDVLDLDTIKDCPICRDDYEVNDDLLSLPCRHAFHPDCITTWLRTSGTCPVCRFSLVPQPSDTPAEDPTSPLAGPSSASGPTSPSTSRIPEVQGSRLPGSFPFPPSSRRPGDEPPDDLEMEDVD